MRVREMVMAEMSKLDQQRVNEFLNACSEGNEYRIRKVRVGVEGGWVCGIGGGLCLCGWWLVWLLARDSVCVLERQKGGV
jgi:hypothetical protein